MTYRTTLALVLTLAASVTSAAWAGDPKAASEAYNKASEAFARKSYAEAAAGFAVADGLEPNPVALESALKAAILADEPVLGMELVERGASRPPDPRVETQMKRARERFAARAGQLSVSCPDERGCSAKLDATTLPLGKRVWVRPGTQPIEVTIEGQATRHQVEVAGGAVVDFVPPAPPRPPPPAPPVSAPPPQPSVGLIAPEKHDKSVMETDGGISPAWFAVGAVATAALAGVTIWSGIDTLNKHDAFLAGNDAQRGPGRDAQLRTNILLGATLASAAGAAITGIFVDWGTSGQTAAVPFPRGVAVRLRY